MVPMHWFGRCPIRQLGTGIRILEYASPSNLSKGIHAPVTRYLQTSSCFRFKEDHQTKSLAILDNVKQVRHSPTPALLLGFSGLIPFVAAPLYMVSSGVYMPEIAEAQLLYGASILSFLGGVRWGLTLPMESIQAPDWHNLGYSVTPSLIAVAGLLMPLQAGFLTIIGGLGFTGYMDLAMWGYPNWFKGLRFCLTFVAVLSLWTSFMFKFVMPKAKVEAEDSKKDTSV